MSLLWLLWACSGTQGPPPVAKGHAIALREVTPTLELSAQNRDSEPNNVISMTDWRRGGANRGGAIRWIHRLPVRPRSLFFHQPKPGMEVTRDGESVPFGNGSNRVAWGYSATELFLNLPEGEEPGPNVTFSYPKGTERERTLHRFTTDDSVTDQKFIQQQVQDGWTSRSGIMLPAPSTASWAIAELPAAAELHFVPTLVEPEQLDGPASDGASIAVDVEVDGVVHTIHEEQVALHSTPYRRIDLSKWSGRAVTLTIRTLPGASNAADHVFLGEPVIASKQSNPRKVLMVFIDTLRPDHMGLYGYERDTTTALSHLDGTAAIFTNARSVAPWTLPSARSIVTGMQPEAYAPANLTLQETMRKEGWATAFIAGNVYLSANFDMHRGWDYHSVGMWPLAEVTTDEAMGWLDEREGRDVLLQVHYMGVHLPYKEPRAYRHLFAGEGPDGLPEEFHLTQLRAARVSDPEDQQYIRDRYDNNIRYVTDQVQRLVARLDDNDVLLLFSDHGEEFWDHGGLEHGHTTYDELLRVPVVLRAPGVKPGRIETPISLLDLTPTLLELVGIDPAQKLDGSSLVPLANGDASAFVDRDHAFGRPLYGQERWGVIADGKKWSTHEGREILFDLDEDPEEKSNLLKKNPDDQGAPFREHLANALQLEVPVSYRLQPSAHKRGPVPPDGLEVICTVPGGVRHVWAGDDPLDSATVVSEVVSDVATAYDILATWAPQPEHARPADLASVGVAHIKWTRAGAREVYITPKLPLAEAGPGMQCTANYCPGGTCEAQSMVLPADRNNGLSGRRNTLTKVMWKGHRELEWTYAMAPFDPREISGRDDESNSALEALGYKDSDAEEDEATPNED